MPSFQLTPGMFFIVGPLLFLAGFVDSIAGGGGLISLPAYMLTGMPMHSVLATNKLSSTCGTSIATIRFIRNGLVDFKLSIPAMIAAILGSVIGSHIALIMPDVIIERILLFVLPAAAFFVLNKNLFKEKEEAVPVTRKTYAVTAIASLIIGMYDGLYGAGTGTFLIIAFTVFAKMDMKKANAQAKVINLTSNITALIVFILSGKVVFLLGLAGAACNIAGNYLGAGLVMSRGAKVVKPILLVVLTLLFIKIVTGR